VTELAANFSPIPRIAPPPFGNEICGAAVAADFSLAGAVSIGALFGLVSTRAS
jgi:hypothetical protein